MRLFRRAARSDAGAELRRAITDVVVLADEEDVEARRRRLLRVVAEGVVLQDEADEVLAEIRAHAPLHEVAQRGGPLARRFLALRDSLPEPSDTAMARQCATASVVLDHHGHVIVYALELLAAEYRSPRISEQLERLEGLGAPSARLDRLYHELTRQS